MAESFKKSKFEWFDEIPLSWSESKISYLFEIGRGRVISQQELKEDGMYPVYSSQTKDNGCMGMIETYDFDDNLITWTTDGANAGTVFIREGKFNCTNVCGTLKPILDIELKYYYYYLQFVTQFYKRPDTNGAKIMNNEMANIHTLIPPKETQIRIAEFLDKKTAETDTIIQKKESLLLLLEEKKKVIINEAVTGKKIWNGNAWTEPVEVKDSGIEWIGDIPEHWEIKKLKYLVEYIESGCSVNAEDSPIENIDELGVLKTSCVYNYSFDDSENKKIFKEEHNRVKCPVKENTIIVSRMNTPELVGASGYVSKSYSNLYLPDRLWQLNFSNEYENIVEYISIILSSELYKRVYSRIATGSSPSMKNISQESYLGIDIILPPVEDSLNILEYIRNSIENLTVLKIKLTTQINKLKEYRQSLISEAVTGKIDI